MPPCARANVRAGTLHTHAETHHTLTSLFLSQTHARTRTAVVHNATPRALQQRLARLVALGTLQYHSCLRVLLPLGLARRLVRSPVRALALWETRVTLPLSSSRSLTHLGYSTPPRGTASTCGEAHRSCSTPHSATPSCTYAGEQASASPDRLKRTEAHQTRPLSFVQPLTRTFTAVVHRQALCASPQMRFL
jgi:hypothetical protein